MTETILTTVTERASVLLLFILILPDEVPTGIAKSSENFFTRNLIIKSQFMQICTLIAKVRTIELLFTSGKIRTDHECCEVFCVWIRYHFTVSGKYILWGSCCVPFGQIGFFIILSSLRTLSSSLVYQKYLTKAIDILVQFVFQLKQLHYFKYSIYLYEYALELSFKLVYVSLLYIMEKHDTNKYAIYVELRIFNSRNYTIFLINSLNSLC